MSIVPESIVPEISVTYIPTVTEAQPQPSASLTRLYAKLRLHCLLSSRRLVIGTLAELSALCGQIVHAADLNALLLAQKICYALIGDTWHIWLIGGLS